MRLSLVIPVYNEERFLKRCLDAIARQTAQPFEVIVVNNNSTDRSTEIAKSYPFVRVLNEKAQGIVFARNRGFDAARGDIIGRIDADTILPSDWVERVCTFYEDDSRLDCALTGGGFFYNMRWPALNGWIQSQLAYRTNRFVLGHYITWGSNMALPKKIWQEVKNNVCVRDDLHEDLDLSVHLHERGYRICYDASLKAGMYLKRIWGQKEERSMHGARWPRTLRVHGKPFWWMGVLGNIMLFPLIATLVAIEHAATFIGLKPLDR